MINTNYRSLEYINMKKSSGIHEIENIKGLYLFTLALPLVQIAALIFFHSNITTIYGRMAFSALILLIGLPADALALYTRYYIQRTVGYVPVVSLWFIGAALVTKIWYVLCV